MEPDKNKILDTIDFVLHNKDFPNKISRCKNKFGNGKASQKIVKIIKELKIDYKLIRKQITY